MNQNVDSSILAELNQQLPKCVELAEEHGLGLVANVDSEDLLETAHALRDMGFDMFMFVTAIDYPEKINLTYHLLSIHRKNKPNVFIKTEVPKNNPAIDSIVEIWPNANWHERETYDLFGVEFRNHPDLERIFMPEDWVGYPLRKDYTDDHMIVFPDGVKKEKPEKAAGASKEPLAEKKETKEEQE